MGLIHLDAGVVIGLLDADDAHHETANAAIARIMGSRDRLAMAASAFTECLVGPQRRGHREVAVVEDLFEQLPIEIVDLDPSIARRAAALRAHHARLRLPDALVIATAVERSADELITTDRRWPTRQALKLTASITLL
ncbi:MAG: PIN domain-containing protein [Acidimicrobiales bacterium]|nr:PIN domain-containing protein [Acidimicrobiales bacterium]